MTRQAKMTAKKSAPLFKMAQLVKLPLINNTKKPMITGWADNPEKCLTAKIYPHNNVGLLTGESVGITVVDVDVKNGTLERFQREIIAKHGNPSPMFQQTPSGGLHYFFAYTPIVKTRTYNGIDIRNNGAYVCTEGTTINGNGYKMYGAEFLSDLPPIPAYIYRFIAEQGTPIAITTSTHKKTTKKKASVCFTEAEMRNIMDGIPVKAWDDYSTWFAITCACKSAYNDHRFMRDLWDEYSQKSDRYCATGNMKTWDSIVTPIVNADYLNQVTENKTRLKYYKPYNAIHPDTERTIIHEKYLHPDMYETHATVVVKSATGTGKTVSVAEYLKANKKNFISIVALVSLANAQHEAFTKHGLTPTHYQNYKHGHECPEQFVTTIDSLRKYEHRDDRTDGYVILLDEVNSLLKYLVRSDTMRTHRRTTYKLFLKLLKQAEKVIAVDADLSDLSLQFLKQHRHDVLFIENTYQNAKGIIAYEHDEKAELYSLMRDDVENNRYFMMATDSKDEAELAYTMLKRQYEDKADKFILHTADSDEVPTNIQEQWKDKFVFFSPKVVYGLDYVSVDALRVYMIAKTFTISPLNMAQQIARARNIQVVHYWVSDTSKWPKWADYNDAYDGLKTDFAEHKELYDSMGLLDDNDKVIAEHDFLRWYVRCLYDEDTFAVRPKRYFQQMLQAKGFTLAHDKAEKVKINTKELRVAIREEKVEKYNKAVLTPEAVNAEYLQTVRERWDIIGATTEKERLSVEWVANNPYQFNEHMRVLHAMDGDEKQDERLHITGQQDYACVVPKSEAYKLQVLRNVAMRNPLLPEADEDKPKLHGITDEHLNKFKSTFRLKFTNSEVKTRGDLEQKRLKAMRQKDMFMSLVTEKTKRIQKQVHGVRSDTTVTTYSLDEETIADHLRVIAIRPYHRYTKHELFKHYNVADKPKIMFRDEDSDEGDSDLDE